MPEIEIPIGVGVFKDETDLAAEGYCIDTQGYRIHRGRWLTQRGYEKSTSDSFSGIVRGAAAWADLSGVKTAGFGTAAKLYNFYGGSINDVTPLKLRGTGTDIFTTDGSTAVVIVEISNHGLKAGDTFYQSYADAVGGITFDASYSVTEVLDLDRFTITHGSVSTSPATGGGKCEYYATLDTGLVDGVSGIGFGTAPWGSGYYGIATSGDTDARRWQIKPWGQNMLAVPPGGALYEMQPAISYPELVTNGDFAASDGWTAGTGYSIGSGVATASAGTGSDLTQDLTGLWAGGVTYEVSMDVTVSAGALQMKVTSNPGSPTDFNVGESIEESGTYTRYFQAPPSPTILKFSKDSSFAGTIDNVSIKMAEIAYRIPSAPQYNGGVTVDANNIAIVWSTVRADGVYDRRCVRWSDLGDNKTWLASDTNYAGENSDFGVGSGIVAVVPTRSENLVFTDAGVYSMTFTGDVGDAFAFDLIGGGAGLKAPGAVAEHAGRVFWWGVDNNFYIYQGTSAQILECPLRRDVVDNFAPGQASKISFHIRAAYSEVRIIYPDSRDGNEISRAIVFNWVENKWYNDTETRSEYIGTSVFNEILGFGQDGYIYYHDLGNSANGDALTCSLQTGFYDLGDGHNLVTLKRFFPDFDDQVGDISFSVIARDRPRGTENTYGPYTVRTTTTSIPLRILCREFALKFEGDTAGLEHRFGSFRIEMDGTSARR